MKRSPAFGRVQRACQRRLAKWLGRRPFTMRRGPAIVSFTFDDFPRSALQRGGTILEDARAVGTYYVSLGLAGRTFPTGELFTQDDLSLLLASRHELGCHTFDHSHAWNTSPADFEASVRANADALARLAPGSTFATASYPISYPRPATKRRIGHHVSAARGGDQTFNHETIDLNYLSAFFIEQSRDNPDAIKRLIEANARAGGWLIFATHDVDEQPTRYGCTPTLFARIVRDCVQAGSTILSMSAALETIGVPVQRPLAPALSA